MPGPDPVLAPGLAGAVAPGVPVVPGAPGVEGVPVVALGVAVPVVPEGVLVPGAGVAVPVPLGFPVAVPGVVLGAAGELVVPFWPGVVLEVPWLPVGVPVCGVVLWPVAVLGAVAGGGVVAGVPVWPVPLAAPLPAWATANPAVSSRAAGISSKRIS